MNSVKRCMMRLFVSMVTLITFQNKICVGMKANASRWNPNTSTTF
jgi:hypothetical protein